MDLLSLVGPHRFFKRQSPSVTMAVPEESTSCFYLLTDTPVHPTVLFNTNYSR